MAAILAQAENDAVARVRIEFPTDDTCIRVRFDRGDGWEEAMTIPASLAVPLKGAALRAGRLGYRRMLPHVRISAPQPGDVAFQWEPAESADEEGRNDDPGIGLVMTLLHGDSLSAGPP